MSAWYSHVNKMHYRHLLLDQAPATSSGSSFSTVAERPLPSPSPEASEGRGSLPRAISLPSAMHSKPAAAALDLPDASTPSSPQAMRHSLSSGSPTTILDPSLPSTAAQSRPVSATRIPTLFSSATEIKRLPSADEREEVPSSTSLPSLGTALDPSPSSHEDPPTASTHSPATGRVGSRSSARSRSYSTTSAVQRSSQSTPSVRSYTTEDYATTAAKLTEEYQRKRQRLEKQDLQVCKPAWQRECMMNA